MVIKTEGARKKIIAIFLAIWILTGYKMPKKLERKLKKQASELGLTGNRYDAYVFGTLRRIGGKK